MSAPTDNHLRGYVGIQTGIRKAGKRDGVLFERR